MFKLEKLLRIVCFAVIYLSIITRIVSFFYNRSLWLDEGYLASSVVQRNYSGLLLPLDFNQGAPIGYLWIVKSMIYILGSSEYVLRLLSLVSGIAAVFVFYKVLQNVFNDKKPYIGTAFFSTIHFLLYYSIEFKPYMFDGLITLVSLYIFHLALKGKIKPWLLLFYCSTAIWFSFPVIFTIAVFCMMWFLYSLYKKQKMNIIISLSTGLITLLSFSLYYYFFYANLTANQSLKYWDLIQFPFFPKNIEDLKLIKSMESNYMSAFNQSGIWIIRLLSIASIFLLLIQNRKPFVLYAYFLVILVLFASSLGYYGILNRILLFLIPVHVLLLSLVITEINLKWSKTGFLLSLIFIFLNLNSFKYLFSENVYRNKREINPVIEFLSKTKDSIPVYLYRSSIPSYEYKTGFKGGISLKTKLPFQKENVIYGSSFYRYIHKKAYSWETVTEAEKLKLNIDAIRSHPKVYLLISNYPSEHLQTLLDTLKRSGNISEVFRFVDTPLYLYIRYE